MKLFEKNVGKADKAVRAVLGLLLIGAFAFGNIAAPLSYVALLAGIAMLATAAFGYCGLYTLLGINTCGLKKK